MTKYTINRFPSLRSNFTEDADVENAIDTILSKLTDRQEALHAAARAAVKPISHTITITPKG
jgi:hypothetical protein